MKLKKCFRLNFRHFRTRLLFYIIGLLLLTLSSVLGVVNYIFRENTENVIRHDLLVTERIFLTLLQERSSQLSQQVRVLASDFAFKRVMATFDNATITSALLNLEKRVKADAAFLVAVDYSVMVDSLHFQNKGERFFVSEFIKQAETQEKTAPLVIINQTPYQLIIVPILAPEPIAWLCLGFRIDGLVLTQLKQLTQVEISLFSEQNLTLQLQASTLPQSSKTLSLPETDTEGFLWNRGNELFLSRLVTLDQNSNAKLVALIERPWEKALENFYSLQWLLLLIALLSIVIVGIAALFLAKTVSKPVQTLAQGVLAIGRGDYNIHVPITSYDEMGQLGEAFNKMGVQLLEKEKIRVLLGKVVSPAVANELLKYDVVLGGENREITALFSDLEGFTSIAESMSAPDLVALLNDYLTLMSDEINNFAGVLDKFIGDAIVAFWGAPVDNVSHAKSAVYCALAMQKTLKTLCAKWEKQGLPLLSMRIGINTGHAVVGNVGSIDRLDYTMIGDSVNLAARLENANKYYGSEIIISEFTFYYVKNTFVCRELDNVRVQGKQKSVVIYEVICERSHLTEPQQIFLALFSEALALFHQRKFDQAKIKFSRLVEDYNDKASMLYLQRLEQLDKNTTSMNDFDLIYDLLK